jgi:hypothetical protein
MFCKLIFSLLGRVITEELLSILRSLILCILVNTVKLICSLTRSKSVIVIKISSLRSIVNLSILSPPVIVTLSGESIINSSFPSVPIYDPPYLIYIFMNSCVGEPVGSAVGFEVGKSVGTALGLKVGSEDGAELGRAVGAALGEVVGSLLGLNVGATEGAALGEVVGSELGRTVGAALGEVVGSLLGLNVGATEGAALGVKVGAALGEVVGKTDGNRVGVRVGGSNFKLAKFIFCVVFFMIVLLKNVMGEFYHLLP